VLIAGSLASATPALNRDGGRFVEALRQEDQRLSLLARSTTVFALATGALAFIHCSSDATEAPAATSPDDAEPPTGEPTQDAGGQDSAADAGSACAPRRVPCSTGCCEAGQTSRTVAAGLWFGCAIAGQGTVKCWGWAADGQTGQGKAVGSSTPETVPNVTDVVAITAGNRHACALSSTGSVTCWGANDFGQLGGGTTVGNGPVTVEGLDADVVAISAGRRHTCAITGAGRVKCWGRNYEGTLGDATQGDSLVPVDVGTLPEGRVALVSSGGLSRSDFPENPSSANCVLSATGALRCFGAYAETPASLVADVADVSARGNQFQCALTTAGEVWCWGFYNNFGQLGPETPDGVDTLETPLRVGLPAKTHAVAVESGSAHTCVRTEGGGVKCWGYNGGARLGTGSYAGDRDFSRTPVDVVGLSSGVVEIAAGESHTCVRMATGKVLCWGSDGYGALGRGEDQTSSGALPGEVAL
jgi:alpha-tubulin suppressor-like RCC1 family protein